MRSMIRGCVVLACLASAAHADSEAPSIPDNVSAVAGNSSIRVDWSSSWDNEGVDGYNVYRDGRYRATVRDTDYTDYGLDAGDRHSYEIVAFDDARNYTSQSEPAVATVGGEDSVRSSGRPGTPDAPDVEGRDDGTIRVSWSAASGDVRGYNIYRDGSYRSTVTGGATRYEDRSVDPGREYRYAIVAFSNDGRFSSKSSETAGRTGGGGGESRSLQDDDTGSRAGGAPDGYELVFSDEFRGSSVDERKWNTSYRWGPDWIINNEKQYYVDTQEDPDFGYDPFSFDGEHLTISARRTPDDLRSDANWQRWMSGALTTYKKFTMKYGYVEMRAKLPRGQGLWPAFWLLHQSETDHRPEIDVVEMLGRDPDTVYQTYHWYEDYSLRSTPSYRVEETDYSDDFHTYGMLWEPGKVTWYVDGRETHQFDSGNVSSENMYILVNLAVGGTWAGSPDDSTPSPSRYTIDFIRAYRR